MDSASIRFSVTSATPGWPVTVSLRRGSHGWVAKLDGAGWPVGIGPTAGAAVRAALRPLGKHVVTAVLADIALLEPSLRVLEAERQAV
ncbi:MAG TPA: hypothetical protein VM305_09540 [Candidatus Limnocylindrales bacterium]|nr:hypothetical protein [Candidatus Limnocylindrales bacterium]